MLQLPNPRWMALSLALIALATCVALVGTSCGTAPTPFLVTGPGQSGNDPPTLTILQPSTNITRGQGEPFLIQWVDSDQDDNALIDFWLVNTQTAGAISLVQGIQENDLTGPDSFAVNTQLIPTGTYNLLGTISDGVNETVNVFATMDVGATAQRIVVTVVGQGEGPPTVPPALVVTAPAVNLSVTQDDVLVVTVQPPPGESFDPDSGVALFLVLDVNVDPNDDDPANPDESEIIVLAQRTLAAETTVEQVFQIVIDLGTVPPRPGGDPYFIRVTAYDGTNPPVHRYASGTINVVQLAAGTVDLFDIGRTKAGARFYGFNPAANLGSTVRGVTDFDADGVDDFIVVAQFGNPRGAGPVGEAYLVYGQPGSRFGGSIAANSISRTVSGVVFEAPPERLFFGADVGSAGITDVNFIPDLSGDGRPELIFGLPLVVGAFDATDFDPADEDVIADEEIFPFGCYPDLLVNNCTDGGPNRLCTLGRGGPADDAYLTATGIGVIVNSENRDNDPLQVQPPDPRLDSTAVTLELVGQETGWVLDADGFNTAGSIFVRAEDPDGDPGRLAGARFAAGAYDFIGDTNPFSGRVFQGPRLGRFGQTVSAMGDLNQDGLPEIMISAPRNEAYLQDLLATFGTASSHFFSTLFTGSITVLPSGNYAAEIWRDDGDGSSVIPNLDRQRHGPFGQCTDPPGARHFDIPAESFEVLAESPDDMLGGARDAGDFNQDGIADILCGAYLNDGPNRTDSGAVYILYGRPITGSFDLADADDPVLRPPMLRIRGLTDGDQIGWRQGPALDVNGDRLDDVVISSPRTDFGGVMRTTCAVDFNGDGTVDDADLTFAGFFDCQLDLAGSEVFSDDACRAFDYDNDRDIDDDDRCVFCCLSGECEPDEACTLGTDAGDCCANIVDNGFVAVVFGGVFTDGDRDISQIATPDLPGVVFYGNRALDRAGLDASSAADFNQDGFGDILIAVPGETRTDSAARERLGVVYLIFGGTHLINTTWNLSQVGTSALPGIVFLSPYVKGRPNEAPPTTVGLIGDINGDGFGDIAIGNPMADFIDLSFPQGPDAPGTDAAVGRRRNAGDAYVIYGNNFGSNRVNP